jgi:hypothetical protein
MAVTLVTLEQAKKRCRVVSDDEDDDITSMIEEASKVIIERVDDATVTDTWDEDTVPPSAKAATLEMVLFLHERDSTINQRPDNNGRLPARVELLLGRLIKPALA